MESEKLLLTGRTEAGMREVIKARLAKIEAGMEGKKGARVRCAWELGISAPLLANILSGRRPPSRDLIGRLGFRREVVYVEVPSDGAA